MEGMDTAWMLLTKAIDDLTRAVRRAVVDRNDQHLIHGIVHTHQCSQDVGDYLFFVVRCHQDSHWRPEGRVDVDVRMALESKKTIQCEEVVARGIHRDKDDDRVEGVKHIVKREL